MKLSRLVGLNSVVYLVFGVLCILKPLRLADLYGAAFGPGSMLICELFGVFALGFGLVLWRMRAVPREVLQLLAWPLAVANFVGFAVYLLALSFYAVNPLGWALVAVQCGLGLAYLACAFDRPAVAAKV